MALDVRNILAYADDLVLLAQSVCVMCTVYSTLCTSINEHKLAINRVKTESMIFSTERSECTQRTELNGDLLEVVNSFNYLGHNLRYNFREEDGIAFKLNCFYASINSILRGFTIINRDVFFFFLIHVASQTMVFLYGHMTCL